MAGAPGRMPGFLSETTHRGPRRDPSLVPFTALQILVLAFFIVLNVHAEHDAKRSRDVTESIQAKFAGLDLTLAQGPQAGAADPDAEKILNRVMTTFQGLIPLEESLTRISANEQYLRLPIGLFFDQGTAVVKQPIQSLLAQLMRALDRRPAGWAYEVELVLRANPPDMLTRDRAANIAVALTGHDASDRYLTVALGQGDPNWLVLLVRLRPDATGESSDGSAAPSPGAGQ